MLRNTEGCKSIQFDLVIWLFGREALGDTVDGINLATPRAPRGPKFYKFRFFVVLRVPGGPGAITNRRGMKKHARGLIFVNFGWIYEGFVPFFDF